VQKTRGGTPSMRPGPARGPIQQRLSAKAYGST
jgi:hypothetical protein